jgi:hypothetical protein
LNNIFTFTLFPFTLRVPEGSTGEYELSELFTL